MPPSRKKRKVPKWYAVRRGRQPGVYETWEETERQVSGFPGAVHRSFPTREDAEDFVETAGVPPSSRSLRLVRSVQQASNGDAKASHRERRAPVHPTGPSSPQTPKPTHTQSTVPLEPPLSPEQSSILDRILAGENFFFTGSAGTGKSVLLRAIVKAFRERHAAELVEKQRKAEEVIRGFMRGGRDFGRSVTEDDEMGEMERWKLGITASTGMAAVNIGGCTLHSWAGIGLGRQPAQQLYEGVMRNEPTKRRWRETGALVIDEVSMIDGALFDKLEALARRIRGNDKPFGGLQIILSGDFYQLPPVAERDGAPPKFAFEADSWNSVIKRENVHALTRVFRQKEDKFVRILERMRKGKVEESDIEALRACRRVVYYEDDIEPVGLYPSKAEVNAINTARLKAIDAPLQAFMAWDQPGINSKGYSLSKEEATACLDRNTMWPKELEVKVGAMVMLITNMQDGTLVNGSTGIVTDFLTLRQAAEKQVYLPDRAAFGNPNPDIAWPAVEFIQPKYAVKRDVRRVLIPQMSVDVLNAMGEPEATRFQVPLILSFAITIHKSQGQSIERLRVDLGRVFEKGQTYVALSRATSLENLEVLNFSPSRVMAHQKVVDWAMPFEEQQAEDEEWDDLLRDPALDI